MYVEPLTTLNQITHSHFDSYDQTLSADERAKDISESVIDFLTSLFSNKLLMHRSSDGRSGGSRIIKQLPLDWPAFPDDLLYLWSGPITKDLSEG
jgi:hypothetical protein